MKYDKTKNEIILNRTLSELDKFVLDFINILKIHTDYVIVSGYVSILLGRSRATEDVDIFIKRLTLPDFINLYNSLIKHKFWCLNAEDPKEIFSYLKEGLAVRFAKAEKTIPNFEIKFPKSKIDEGSFNDHVRVFLQEGILKISSLERHIAFKRYFLKSDKDLEDALHIEELFKEDLDYDKINKLKSKIEKHEESK